MSDEKRDEAVKVEAEVFDVPAELTAADEWLADARDEVGALLGKYGTHPIETQADYRDIKQSRTLLRKDIASIDQRRMDMTRAVEDAVARFRTGAADALEPLRKVEREYKAQLDEWDAGVIDRRRAAMREAYADMAPALADGLCPFDLVWDLRGPGLKWQNRSTGEGRCMDDLAKVVEGIARDEGTIQALDMSPEERDACRAEYFRTLDLGAAVGRVRDERERLARIAELDAQRAAQAASLKEAQTSMDVSPAPAQARTPRRPERPAPRPAATDATAGPAPRRRYVFEFECTNAQLDALMAFLRENDIHGTRRNV